MKRAHQPLSPEDYGYWVFPYATWTIQTQQKDWTTASSSWNFCLYQPLTLVFVALQDDSTAPQILGNCIFKELRGKSLSHGKPPKQTDSVRVISTPKLGYLIVRWPWTIRLTSRKICARLFLKHWDLRFGRMWLYRNLHQAKKTVTDGNVG